MADLISEIASFSNLMIAYKKTRRGDSGRYKSTQFFYNLEKEIISLRDELTNGTYSTGHLTRFMIYDPKEREISAAPIRDRVVYHAIFNILEPLFEKYMIHDSFACRKGKGTHAAVRKAQYHLRKNKWYLKADIKKYFDSIEHSKLFEILSGLIKDETVLSLFQKILAVGGNSSGLPIGNLTSQHFANLYLSRFDHFIKDHLGYKGYLRYMDDFVIFSNDKEDLKELLGVVRRFLRNELMLDLKEKAVVINKDQNGLSFLGWRIYKNTIRIRRQNFYRSADKIRKRYFEYQQGLLDDETFAQSLASINGHISYFNTKGLMRQFYNRVNTVN